MASVVRLVKAEAALGDFCQVFAEDAPKNTKPDLWVSRRFMVDVNDVDVGKKKENGLQRCSKKGHAAGRFARLTALI